MLFPISEEDAFSWETDYIDEKIALIFFSSVAHIMMHCGSCGPLSEKCWLCHIIYQLKSNSFSSPALLYEGQYLKRHLENEMENIIRSRQITIWSGSQSPDTRLEPRGKIKFNILLDSIFRRIFFLFYIDTQERQYRSLIVCYSVKADIFSFITI